ncbi:MAG: hypothetical protein WBB15_16750 [Ornithinimicrobium sp.]
MKTLGPSRRLAGAAVSLPLLVLLVGSVVIVAIESEPPVVNTGLRAFALGATVLVTLLAALVSAIGRWIPAPFSRVVIALCGGIAAAGASVVATAAGDGSFWVVVPVIGVGWGWVVSTLHGAERPEVTSVLQGIPERDRLWGSGAASGAPASRYAAGSASGDLPVSASSAGQVAGPWTVQITSRRMAALTVFGALTFTAIVILSLGLTPTWWLIVVAMLGVGFCTLTVAWSRIEVHIDESGVQIRSQTLRLPLVSVQPSEILGVASAEVDPMVYGGWGLRWSSRHTAFVIKGGPGLLIYRASGRQLAIEMPDGSDCADDGARAVRAAVADPG